MSLKLLQLTEQGCNPACYSKDMFVWGKLLTLLLGLQFPYLLKWDFCYPQASIDREKTTTHLGQPPWLSVWIGEF